MAKLEILQADYKTLSRTVIQAFHFVEILPCLAKDHSKHRFFNYFIANSLSIIAAYCFFEKKPAIDVCFVKDGQLAMF